MDVHRIKRLGIKRIGIIGGGSLAVIAVAISIGVAAHAQTKPQTNALVAKPLAVKPAAVNAAAAQQPAGATSSSAAASTSNSPAATPYKLNFRPGPMILRRPQGPALVLWSQVRGQATKMRQAHPVNSFLSRLPKNDIDRTRLPVLLPHEGSSVATDKGRLFSFGDAYAMNLPQAKGTQITFYGNRSFVPADKGAVSRHPLARLNGMAEDVRIDQTEDGWTATFTRYGVVYSIDVTCDDQASPDCTSDAYIRKQITQFDDVTMGQDATNEANGINTTNVKQGKPAGNWLDQVSQSIKNITGAK